MKIAELDGKKMAKIKALEDELGTCVVALEPKFKLAKLAPDAVDKLQGVEKDLGVVLLAYSC